SASALRDDLACRLFQAVVGVSRLPLTSVETPLPAFALGQFGYCHRPAEAGGSAGPLREPSELLTLLMDDGLARAEQVKPLELMIRATAAADIPALANQLVERCSWLGRPPDFIPALFREVFNSISLSPYTDFVGKALAFLRHGAAGNVPEGRAA